MTNNTTKTLGFKRLSPDAILPTKAHATDSGYDLYAVEDVIIEPGETAAIKTGIAVQLPEGCEAQVRPKSGITSKTKLRVQFGTVDRGYSGEVGVIVDNISEESAITIEEPHGNCRVFTTDNTVDEVEGDYDCLSYIIRKHDKIAQLVVQYLPQVEAVEVDELYAGDLTESTRGNGGFGSTGNRAKEDE